MAVFACMQERRAFLAKCSATFPGWFSSGNSRTSKRKGIRFAQPYALAPLILETEHNYSAKPGSIKTLGYIGSKGGMASTAGVRCLLVINMRGNSRLEEEFSLNTVDSLDIAA